MARLPIPGSDERTWGDILNEFLGIEHNADGTQKDIPQSKVTNLVRDLAGKADADALSVATSPVLHERLGAGILESIGGSPTSNNSNNVRHWRLADNASQGVGAALEIPIGITEVNIDVMWFATASSDGTTKVLFSLFAYQFTDGTILNSADHQSIFSSSVFPPITANEVVSTRMATGYAVTGGRQLAVRVSRSGTGAADTLVGDIGILAIIVRSPDTGVGSVTVSTSYVELN